MSDVANELAGRCIMVVEDELLVAMGLEDALNELGCQVMGPYPSLSEAEAALDASPRPDGAVLDVNVRGEFVYPLAEKLRAMDVPVVLCSGYADAAIIPETFAEAERLAKPFSNGALVQALRRAIAGVAADG